MGFETIVRPVVFPNIRPAPSRSLAIEDAPDKGIATISGGGASSVISLTHSESHSWSRGREVEVERKYDVARVYYTRPDGTLDKSQYWEFEVLRSIEYLVNGQTTSVSQFAPMQELDNVEVTDRGLKRKNQP